MSSKSEALLAPWGLGAAAVVAAVVEAEDFCVGFSEESEVVCLGGWEEVLEELYRRVLVRKDCWNRGCWFSNHGVGRARSPRAKRRVSIVVGALVSSRTRLIEWIGMSLFQRGGCDGGFGGRERRSGSIEIVDHVHLRSLERRGAFTSAAFLTTLVFVFLSYYVKFHVSRFTSNTHSFNVFHFDRVSPAHEPGCSKRPAHIYHRIR